MSRGHGYLQRRIMRIVERGGATTRAALEDHLEPEGYRSDNVLRALRGLSRAGLLEFREARFASNSVVGPPKPVFFSDEEIMAMLSEPGWRKVPDAPAHRKYAPNRPRGGERTPRVCEEEAEPWVEASPAIERAAWAPGEGGDAV